MFDTPKTKALAKLIKTDPRIMGMSIELPDGVFIYTDSAEWCDDAGAGTFRGDSETDAIRKYRARIQRA